MLSEVCQAEKNKYYMISVICGTKNKYRNKTENRLAIARGGDMSEGNGRKDSKGIHFQ